MSYRHAFLHSVLKQSVKRLLKVRHSEDALYLYFGCVGEALQQAVPSKLHQVFVGILATLPVFKNPAAFRSETAYQLVPEHNALCVGVGGYENRVLVVEIFFYVVVKVVEVGVRPVRNAHNVMPSALIERKGIHFPLRDDALLAAFDSVDVVRQEFRPRHELETLVARSVFRVHEFPVVVVVELHRVRLSVLLWHPLAALRDFHRFDRSPAYPSPGEPCESLVGQRCVACVRRFLVHGFLPPYGCVVKPRLAFHPPALLLFVRLFCATAETAVVAFEHTRR